MIILPRAGRAPCASTSSTRRGARCSVRRATAPGDGLLVERAQRAARRPAECLRHFLAAAAPLPQPCRPTERRGRRAHDAGTRALHRADQRCAARERPKTPRRDATRHRSQPARPQNTSPNSDTRLRRRRPTAVTTTTRCPMRRVECFPRFFSLFSHSTRAFEVRGNLSAAVRRRATHESCRSPCAISSALWPT